MQEDARAWAWVLFGVGITIVFISAGLRRSPTQLRRAQEAVPQAFEKGPLEARGGS